MSQQPGSGAQVDPVGLEHRLTRIEEVEKQHGLELKEISKVMRDLRDYQRELNGMTRDTASALVRHLEDVAAHPSLREERTRREDAQDELLEALSAKVSGMEQVETVRAAERDLVRRVFAVLMESRMSPWLAAMVAGGVIAWLNG